MSYLINLQKLNSNDLCSEAYFWRWKLKLKKDRFSTQHGKERKVTEMAEMVEKIILQKVSVVMEFKSLESDALRWNPDSWNDLLLKNSCAFTESKS